MGGRSISADGRFIVFDSHMPNLVPTDTDETIPGISLSDIFVTDRKTGETESVSVTSSGEESQLNTDFPGTISPDGRYVAFAAPEPNLTPDQPPVPPGTITSGSLYMFVHDRKTRATHWVSKPYDGGAPKPISGTGSNTSSQMPAVSGGGRFIVFQSNVGNLVRKSDPARSSVDVYLREMGVDLGVNNPTGSRNARLGVRGQPGFDRTGVARAPVVNPRSAPENTTGAGIVTRARLIHRPSLGDLFMRLHIRNDTAGARFMAQSMGIVYGLSFDLNGRAYEVRAAAVASSVGVQPTFGLFSCSRDTCTEVSRLEGGFGTTGNEIVAAVPLELLDIGSRSKLAALAAYSAIGSYWSGPVGIPRDRLFGEAREVGRGASRI